ncbi:MAG: glycosyltransferase [Gemmataceae bacterium]|nr:glycosyltransferase [Gemmataceae bacterium]MDW8265818.1 glycosyltransferase [Gemmataceae bacterium]
MRVSLSMIVKNEEANLPACLESVADLVDEIVIVDTGSTDRTKEVAARFGARVYDFPWIDHFAAARNEGLKHVTGDWVFWLDADDRLDLENRAKLRALFAGLQDVNLGYMMRCWCLADAKTGEAMYFSHLRLFRNHPLIRWEFRVHEQILPSIMALGGQVQWTDIVIRHHSYQDPVAHRRKIERNHRLLVLENQERPNHPFTLFNLGLSFQLLGRIDQAVPCWLRSLELENRQPGSSIERKLYVLLAQGYHELGQPQQALQMCLAGRQRYPHDVELLFQEALARQALGDWAGAEQCLVYLLQLPPQHSFTGVDAGLHGYKARDVLGWLYAEQGRYAEAEAQFRAAVAQQPTYRSPWCGLAEIFLRQGRLADVERVCVELERRAGGTIEAATIRGLCQLAQGDLAAARATAQAAIAQAPSAVGPRVLLSRVLCQEGRDLDAAEQALRDVLGLAPNHLEARQRLQAVLQLKARRQAV